VIEYKNSVLRLNRHFDSRGSWDEERFEIGAELGALLCKSGRDHVYTLPE